MKKLMLLGGGILLLLVAGIATYILLNVDKLVELAVNEYGPKITKTDVVLKDADIGLFSGSGALYGLRIGNPVNRGFKPRDLLSVDRVSVELDRDSLLTDTILVKEVVIQSPRIAYELKGGSGNNFDALLKNIEESVGSAAKESKKKDKPSAAAEEQAKNEKKVIIENVYIRNGEVTADLTGLPGEGLTIGLPEIHIADIGKEKKGASPAEAARKIVEGLYDGMEKAFAESGDFVMKGGQWVMDQAGGVVGGATDAVGGAAGGAGDAVDGAVKGLKSLF
ncbi:MAG: hypothetical protein V3573_10400 [Desulfovibrionaceae bacterium]